MIKTIKKRIIAIIIAIILISVTFYVTGVNNDSVFQKYLSEYPYLNITDSLNNTISISFWPKGWREGTILQFVTLDNGKKYTISASTKEIYNLDMLKANMKIFKKANNDTIIVSDDFNKYTFIYFDNE